MTALIPDDRSGLSSTLEFPGMTIGIRTVSASFIEQLESLFDTRRSLDSDADSDADAVFEVSENGDRWIVRLDDRLIYDGVDADAALVGLYGHAYELFVRRSPHLLIHTGAVALNGLAMLLPGSERSGKSTLTAVLAGRGAQVLSDDVGAVDPESMTVFPYPRHMLVREATMRRVPGVLIGIEVLRELSAYGELVHVARPRNGRARRPQRVALLVFPTWSTGGTVKKALRPGEAAARLMDNSLNLKYRGAVGVRMVAEVVRRVPAYQLRVRDAEEAADLLMELYAG